MTSLPSSWEEVKWIELTSDDGFRRGPFGGNLKKSFFVSEGYAVYEQFAPINDDCSKLRYFIDEEKYQELASFWVNEGDFLISCSGTMGRITRVPPGSPLGVINQALLRIRLISGASNPDYFLKLFRSPVIQEKVLKKSGGGAIQNLASVKELKEITFPIAPLNEQTRIANKLDELLAQVDTIKARVDAIPDILKRFRQSVLAAAVSGKLTEEWREENDTPEWKSVKLGEVGSGFNYGSSAKSQKTGEIPVLRMGNIQDGKLDWTDLVYTSNQEEVEKYKLEPGDVLFNRTNSPELVGKTGIYRGERPSIYAGYLIKVKGTRKLDSEYLNILLNSPHGRAYCWKVKTDGVSQSNINAQKLKAFDFILPSKNEQLQIVQRVKQLFTFADQIEQRVKEAQTRINNLSQSILAKAFRGELVPQDPNDEPASVLLERIKQEREEVAKLAKAAKKAGKKTVESANAH